MKSPSKVPPVSKNKTFAFFFSTEKQIWWKFLYIFWKKKLMEDNDDVVWLLESKVYLMTHLSQIPWQSLFTARSKILNWSNFSLSFSLSLRALNEKKKVWRRRTLSLIQKLLYSTFLCTFFTMFAHNCEFFHGSFVVE